MLILAEKVTKRHGYPWVPTDQGLSRPRQTGLTCRKTRRPVSEPARPDMWAQGHQDSLECKSRQSRQFKAVRISLPSCNRLE
jgi:hypothetical protein